MKSPSPQTASARSLVYLMIGVVISFLMATTFAQLRSAQIEQRVGLIVDNALPSVKSIAQARSHLRHETNALARLAEAPHANPSNLREEIATEGLSLRGALEKYSSLPQFSAESRLTESMRIQLPVFESAVLALLKAVESGDGVAISSAIRAERQEALKLDDTLTDIVDFNSTQGQRLGLEIATLRAESMAIAVILDLVSIALAALAVVISIRVLRSSVKTSEERANELERFAEKVAHDLKGPLQGMSISIGMGSRGGSEEKLRTIFSRLKTCAVQLDRIIDGLLDFARAGANPSPDDSAELGLVIDDVVKCVSEEAEKAGVALTTEPFERPVFVGCTEGALTSVISNLVRNAVKFVPDGASPEHRVNVRVKELDGRARVEVEDNGPGIDPRLTASIFQSYVRASSTRPGLGIGLATAKRIVESYGGTIGVRSEPGRGSCFWFELPRRAAPAAHRLPA